MPYELIQAETVYHGRAFDVHRDQVRMPDGQVVSLDILTHKGAVTILPLDERGHIWFVRQYRHATGGMLLELPAGTLETGEPPDECARREIREETGMAAGKLERIGEYYLAPGYSSEYQYVYLATDLRPDPLPGDADEFLSVETLPVAEVYRMAEAGEFRDAKTLATLLLARSRLPQMGA